MFTPDIATEDERYYVPLSETVSTRPIWISISQNSWCDVLYAKAAGLVNRHYHPHEVFAYTISGKWGYLEHDWTATAGDFVYETPGEAHTLVAYESDEPMKVGRGEGRGHVRARRPVDGRGRDACGGCRARRRTPCGRRRRRGLPGLVRDAGKRASNAAQRGRRQADGGGAGHRGRDDRGGRRDVRLGDVQLRPRGADAARGGRPGVPWSAR
jgi:hypothetical protein